MRTFFRACASTITAFITICNHPIGSIDGIILIDIMAARRPDFKVMVNEILVKIGAMSFSYFLFIQ